MLARPGPLPDGDDGWAFEVKWDGMRILAATKSGGVRLTSRNELDVSKRFPEVAESASLSNHLPRDSLIDGEVVAFDAAGTPSFSMLAPRIQASRRQGPAVTYLVFDILYLEGVSLLDSPYDERRALLRNAVMPGPHVIVPDSFDDGCALFASTRQRGLEGVVAKRRNSSYQPGVRSPHWIKIAHRQLQSYVVGGFRPGKSGQPLGSLLVGTPTDDGMLTYDGAVGSGLSQKETTALLTVLSEITRIEPPFHWTAGLPASDQAPVTWVEPVLVVDVEHLGRTANRRLRQPTVARPRPDLDYASLTGST